MSRSGLAVGLLVVLYAAVLGFGGTEPLVFSAAQIGVFLLATIALWIMRGEENLTHPVLLSAFLLLVYVGLQWVVLSEGRTTIERHLLRWLTYVCIFSVAFLLGQERRTRWRLVLGLLALGVFEALYGLVQYLASWPYIFTYRNVYSVNRATGTYINANHFAGLLEMILPLGLAVVLSGLVRFRTYPRGTNQVRLNREEVPRLVFYFFLSLLLFLGILFSGSRMGIFSALAAVVTVMLLWASASWRRGGAISVLLIFLLGAASLGLWLGLKPVIQRYESVESAYLMRLAIWKDTVALIRDRPLLGSGLGTYAQAFTQQQTSQLTRYVDHAHNDFLEFTVELGVLGAGLLFGLIILALIRMISGFYRAESSRDRFLRLGCAGSVLGLLFHGLVDFNLQIPGNALVFAAILGLGCAESGAGVRKEAHGEDETQNKE